MFGRINDKCLKNILNLIKFAQKDLNNIEGKFDADYKIAYISMATSNPVTERLFKKHRKDEVDLFSNLEKEIVVCITEEIERIKGITSDWKEAQVKKLPPGYSKPLPPYDIDERFF